MSLHPQVGAWLHACRRRSMDDGAEGETEDAKLLILALAQRASDFAAVAVMDAPPELVAQLLPVR